MQINWYPGHMAKAKRLLQEQIQRVDAVIELCDARLPYSSRNPDLGRMLSRKARILLLNKADLADPAATRNWLKYFSLQGIECASVQSNKNTRDVLKAIERMTQEKVERSAAKGMKRTIRVMVVGVPNVGKSTLMNLLAKSEVFAENKLFATLDTTVRKVVIENVPFLLSDTVGFIRKLPTQLIEAFKSTLDEVREADILVHVVDISHPDFEEQMQVVEKTLQEIGAGNKPIYVVFNKIDAYHYEEYDEFSLEPRTKLNYTLEELKNSWIAQEKTPCIFISAINKTGLEKLRHDIYKMVAEIHAGRYPFNNFLW